MAQLFVFTDEGIRYVVQNDQRVGHTDCIAVCPVIDGAYWYSAKESSGSGLNPNLGKEWCSVTWLWTPYATDPEMQFLGLLGGTLTARAPYAVELLGMNRVPRIAQDAADPIHNRTCLNRTCAELLAAPVPPFARVCVQRYRAVGESARALCNHREATQDSGSSKRNLTPSRAS